MKIKLTKILLYDLYPANTADLFEYICGVLKQNINPHTLKPKGIVTKKHNILCSPLSRAKECVKILPDAKVKYIPELSEIPFDFNFFCPKEEWLEKKSESVRKYFKEAFIADELLISRKNIEKQIIKISQILRGNPDSEIISHTFRLTLIRAYFETNGEIFKKPNFIHRYILDKKRILNFGESFEVEID